MALGKLNKVHGKYDFDQLVAGSDKYLMVVDFYADWCGPCRQIAPAFEKLVEEHPDVLFAKVNVDEEDEITEACGITAMPTFVLYKNGKKVKSVQGASETSLKSAIDECKKP